MWVPDVLSDWSKDVREVPVHLLCLLQQSVHLLCQRDVVVKAFNLLGSHQTRSASWDDQEVVLLTDAFPLEGFQCPVLRNVIRRNFSDSSTWT